jgi:SpoVK/Ycf46/Vps4 family AAA+-type ATPase
MSSPVNPGEQPRLPDLAQKMEPDASAPDVALLEANLHPLRQIIVRASEPDPVASQVSPLPGLIALFAGTDKAAKAAAVAVLARELRQSAYRVDLAAIVSKYIGETEKNLGRVLDAANASGAILFFDEADALFGQRSEVKDSNDRYANIQVGYLLQRLEQRPGVAIIAANTTAWHHGWLRRMHFVIHFPPV